MMFKAFLKYGAVLAIMLAGAMIVSSCSNTAATTTPPAATIATDVTNAQTALNGIIATVQQIGAGSTLTAAQATALQGYVTQLQTIANSLSANSTSADVTAATNSASGVLGDIGTLLGDAAEFAPLLTLVRGEHAAIVAASDDVPPPSANAPPSVKLTAAQIAALKAQIAALKAAALHAQAVTAGALPTK